MLGMVLVHSWQKSMASAVLVISAEIIVLQFIVPYKKDFYPRGGSGRFNSLSDFCLLVVGFLCLGMLPFTPTRWPIRPVGVITGDLCGGPGRHGRFSFAFSS